MEPVRIDGAHGEGGGQIIRNAVTLSAITGRPVEIENISKNRKIPGLRPQHMVGAKILAKVCRAKVEGLHVGSTSIKFTPSGGVDLELREDIGTAGSIPLVLQVLVPGVSLMGRRLRLSVTGGTDVPWSPTSDYTRFVIGGAFSSIGMGFSADVKRRGYYPRGGGMVEAEILPCNDARPVTFLRRTTKAVSLFCSYHDIPKEEVEMEVGQARKILENRGFSVEESVREEDALDRGCSMLAFSHDESSVIGSDAIYQKTMAGMGRQVAEKFSKSDFGVDLNLSDMLVVPLSLVPETSVFRVGQITKHMETSLFVASKITGCKYGIGRIEGGFEVRISGASDSRAQ